MNKGKEMKSKVHKGHHVKSRDGWMVKLGAPDPPPPLRSEFSGWIHADSR